MKKFLFTLSLVFCGYLLSAAPLFQNQQSSWQIIIPQKADSTLNFAAQELQEHLYKISGAKLAIKRSKTIPGSGAIVIATPEYFKLPGDTGNFPSGRNGNDSLRVKTANGNLYLTGNVSRGALYAVYTFLKDVMGVRWSFAGADGEYIPRKSDFTLPALDIHETAQFKYRGFHLCGKHYDKDMELWMARNKINIMRSDPVGKHKWRKAWNDHRIAQGFHMMFATHNVAIRDRKVFAEKPHLFAELKGTRIIDQLCWSNPEVDKIMIDRFIAHCKEYPQVEILNICPADNMNYCRCEKCAQHPVHELWFKFYNRIISGVKAAIPHLKFATLAYQSFRRVPECSLENSAFVEYCMYNRCYVHRIDECEMNAKPMMEVAQWQKKNIPILVYGYEFDIFSPSAQMPFYSMISDQMKKFKAAKIAGVITEASPLNHYSKNPARKNLLPKGNQNKLSLYAYAALLWNPDRPVDDIIKEYSEAVYGPAGETMTGYAKLMDKSWSSMKIHYSYFSNSPASCAEHLLDDIKIGQIDALFRKADGEIKAGNKDDKNRRNLDEERRVFNVWKKLFQTFQASKSNMKVLLPVTVKPLNFSQAAVLNKFGSRGKFQPWQVKINYDRDALYFDIDCEENDMSKIQANYSAHDSKIYNDDCIELFIAVPNDTRGIYRHLIANTNGVKYDSIALGGFTFNNAWDPDWTVKSSKYKKGWHLQFIIPFASLDTVMPEDGSAWQFSIKRTNGNRKDQSNSGYPDSSYHDQNAFGVMQFTGTEGIIPIALGAPFEREVPVTELKSVLEEAGFQVDASNQLSDVYKFAPGKAAYVFRHTPRTKYDVSFFQQKILPEVQKGALVLFAGYGNIPLDKYFNDPALKISWVGWKIATPRKTAEIKPGNWHRKPFDMTSRLKRGIAPSTGFIPAVPGIWNELCKTKMRDGNLCSYLMTAKCGKGMIVVCSGNFGFSGGLAIFGSNKVQAMQLLKNMLELHKNGN